jgi:hypothetical protein
MKITASLKVDVIYCSVHAGPTNGHCSNFVLSAHGYLHAGGEGISNQSIWALLRHALHEKRSHRAMMAVEEPGTLTRLCAYRKASTQLRLRRFCRASSDSSMSCRAYSPGSMPPLLQPPTPSATPTAWPSRMKKASSPPFSTFAGCGMHTPAAMRRVAGLSSTSVSTSVSGAGGASVAVDAAAAAVLAPSSRKSRKLGVPPTHTALQSASPEMYCRMIFQCLDLQLSKVPMLNKDAIKELARRKAHRTDAGSER